MSELQRTRRLPFLWNHKKVVCDTLPGTGAHIERILVCVLSELVASMAMHNSHAPVLVSRYLVMALCPQKANTQCCRLKAQTFIDCTYPQHYTLCSNFSSSDAFRFVCGEGGTDLLLAILLSTTFHPTCHIIGDTDHSMGF